MYDSNLKHHILAQLPLDAGRPRLHPRYPQMLIKGVDALSRKRRDRECAGSRETAGFCCERLQLPSKHAVESHTAGIEGACRRGRCAALRHGIRKDAPIYAGVAVSDAVKIVETLARVANGIAGAKHGLAVPGKNFAKAGNAYVGLPSQSHVR